MLCLRSLIIVLLLSSYGYTEKIFNIGESGNQYKVTIYHETFIVIKCEINTIHLEDLPHSVTNEMSYLTINNCELPEDSLQDIIEVFGANHTKYIKLVGVPLIKREHFALASAEEIYIRNSNLTSDVFEQQLPITDIDFYNSTINLTETSFSGLTNLDTLILTKCHIDHLPRNIFKALPRLRKLTLSKNLIAEVMNSNFEGLGSLEVLDLSDNPLTSLPQDFLHFLPLIKKLYLNTNPLRELNAESLRGSNLVELNIKDNLVPLALASRALADMPRLKFVSLINCSITTLPVDLLDNSNVVYGIDLSENKIQDIPKNFFKNKSGLKNLDLDNNRLSVLSPETFEHLTNLKILHIDGNSITVLTGGTFSNTNNLSFLWMRNNGLRVISPEALPSSLREIHFENNKLTTLETTLMPALPNLYLSNNSFSSIPLLWRNTFPALTEVDLTDNLFTRITESDFAALPPRCTTLNLSNNKIVSVLVGKNMTLPTWLWLEYAPLRCDCHLHTFATLYEDNMASRSAICTEPLSQKDRSLNNVLYEELVCALEYCPNTCTCKISPERQTLEVECREHLTLEQITELDFLRRQRYSDMTQNTTVKYFT